MEDQHHATCPKTNEVCPFCCIENDVMYCGLGEKRKAQGTTYTVNEVKHMKDCPRGENAR